MFYDRHGKVIDTASFETQEQDMAKKYIEPDDIVLELGARYGTVSCAINSKLANKKNQVSVEPDERVWAALEKNRGNHFCEFNLVKGFISNKKLGLTALDYYDGYGTTSVEKDDSKIPSYTMDQIKKKYNISKFNVLVADCEGFLEQFLDENPELYDTLRLIIFEADYPSKCNYAKIRNTLTEKNFIQILHGHQNVLVRSEQEAVL